MSKTKKIVNMLADDTAAPAAARTLAKAALQEGKLISDYLMERLRPDYALPVTAWDKIKTAAAAAGERRQAEGEKFAPSEPPPTYKEPQEVMAMLLAYKDQIKFLDRLAAPGVDGITWHDYEADLEPRIEDLHGRVHRGSLSTATVAPDVHTEGGAVRSS